MNHFTSMMKSEEWKQPKCPSLRRSWLGEFEFIQPVALRAALEPRGEARSQSDRQQVSAAGQASGSHISALPCDSNMTQEVIPSSVPPPRKWGDSYSSYLGGC